MNTITDYTIYTDNKSEAWAAALNVLATEFLVKTAQPEKYSYYVDILRSFDDDKLNALCFYISLNNHIATLGHMLSHGDYDSIRDRLFEFLKGERK